MKRIYILIFALLFMPLAAYCNGEEEWIVYDVQKQQTAEMTLPEYSPPPSDERVEITGTADENQKPALTLIFFWAKDKDSEMQKGNYCSGALVGKNLVLTAAHCAMDDKGFFTNDVEILAPGVSSLPHAQSTKVIVPKKYKVCSKVYSECHKYDYAFIILNTPLGEKLGYFGTKIYSRRELLHKKIQVLGRGTDKPITTLWAVDGDIGKVSSSFIKHNAYTIPGNSGGPIVLTDNPGNIIAINVFVKDIYIKYPYGGLLITPTIEKMIFQLRKQEEFSKELKKLNKEIIDKISISTKNVINLQQ
ncbi:MAG: trypsin-like serine protease [Elusimicrobiaceae bacterium]|nr:trypsin-like serine protease [Elusimicrobiaceae bacterium]